MLSIYIFELFAFDEITLFINKYYYFRYIFNDLVTEQSTEQTTVKLPLSFVFTASLVDLEIVQDTHNYQNIINFCFHSILN